MAMNKYELPCVRPLVEQPPPTLHAEHSLSYSHTHKNTNKYYSYDSEAFDNKPPQEHLSPKYSLIGDDLKLLNNKLEHLQECFLNMSTITQDKENIRPGMLRRTAKHSRNGSREHLTKRQQAMESYESTKRVSRRQSVSGRSETEGVQKNKEISMLKREVSFCRRSMSASARKKELLEKEAGEKNEKIRNYRVMERKSKKLQADYNKLVKTLGKSEEVRLKQKSLIQKYESEIRRLSRMVRNQK